MHTMVKGLYCTESPSNRAVVILTVVERKKKRVGVQSGLAMEASTYRAINGPVQQGSTFHSWTIEVVLRPSDPYAIRLSLRSVYSYYQQTS